MKYKPLFFILLWNVFLFMPDIQAQTNEIKTVVIDAGHGGKDCGAVGTKSYEKDITLAVALKTGNYIKKKYPDVKVIYTRDKDVSVDLYERADIANRNNADIFISIHCNSVANSPKTGGAETFVMGAHRDKANLDVAMKENASILYEEDSDEHYGGFNPSSTEAYIAMSYLQSEYTDASLKLAECVQNELVNKAKRGDRGVQQAGFLVLYRTAMPSILVELGFISNPKEETYMRTDDGQSYLASAIYRAFCKYKTDYEKEAQSVQEAASQPVEEQVAEQTAAPENKIVYKVQFASRSTKAKNPSTTFKNLKDVDCYEHNGVFKYTAGRFPTRAEAAKYQKEVVAKGYKDAFVVKFQDGKRVN
ncbi:MAG: N-acetylmuramoyl-L-alanine amidase [bacterium]|nr:N-acetylmuramoyl-L-alanine amidase [Candidatus Limimorpha caballi]